VLVVVSGLPGVGKSAVAAALAGRLSAVHLSVDPVEDAMLTAGLPSGWQTGVAAYEVTRASAVLNLAQGRVVVVDAVNDSKAARGTWRDASRSTRVPVVFVLLTCHDEVEHRRRLEGRVRGFGGLPEPTWAEVLERRAGYEPWDDDVCVVVDTGPPLDLVVAEVERRVRAQAGPWSPAASAPVAELGGPADGAAVAVARSALVRHWRSTVVPGDDGGWVVRTWTRTPVGDSRPTGPPDSVHRVEDQGGELVARQVHPAG
jgi:predicted kinase